jgi:integrase/recombinase XerD
LRAFTIYLQRKPRFSDHPYARQSDRPLSGHSVNTYLRGVRAFWSWLKREGIIEDNPFDQFKIPRAPHKVINAFTEAQLGALLAAIDLESREGFRDYVFILTLLDTGLRLSELLGLITDDMQIEEATLKVMGKGRKERTVPVGKRVCQLLWKYTCLYRPDPAGPRIQNVFLTFDGRPITRNRLQTRMAQYGRKAGLQGVRCSPHTLRHTAAISFLRNGGNAFTLQRLLGHSSLEMTRHYCEVADIDLKEAHRTASPVDNLATLRPAGKLRPEPPTQTGKHDGNGVDFTNGKNDNRKGKLRRPT